MRRPLPTEPLLDVTEARARVLERVEPLDRVEVPVAAAPGHVCSDPVTAPHPLPSFDNSAMDGFALRSADTAGATEGAPARLKLVGEIRAGMAPDGPVTEGTAVAIMTGAAVPPGADAVVEVEQTRVENHQVHVLIEVEEGRSIRPAGDDVAAGQVVLDAGVEIGAGEAALLASLGRTPVSVHRRPRVALVVTGDELLDPADELEPGRIRDSNSTALRALVEEAGAEVESLERVADTLNAHISAFERAAAADLIVSSGGVAVGDYDYVKDAVEALGSIDLWRVAMQPGKPVVVGEVGGVPFLGLPGNPVSVHLGFEQFVRPAIRKMRGLRDLLRPVITATLAEPLKKRPGRLHYVRVRLARRGGEWIATPTGAQGSHVQSSLVGCHGVVRFDRDASFLDEGVRVEVEVWSLPHRS